MEGYEVRLVVSSKQLTGKERVAIKDISNAVKLDQVITENEHLTIDVDYTAELSIHNEKAENKDYKVFVIIAKDGTKYITSSESFISSYKNIEEEMSQETEEWALDVYKIPSKNYKGRSFITCSIV